MAHVLLTNARVLTVRSADGPKRGAALRELGVLDPGWVVVNDGRITGVGRDTPPRVNPDRHIDVDGCVVMPAFVDCHTHACWAGQRFDEFDAKLAGATYLELLEAGGGIMATVRAVREATASTLVDLLLHRLWRMQQLGTATAEVKSGYGLTTDDELKMLHAIAAAAERSPMQIVPTFLGAHAIDRDNPRFVDEMIEETLPAVARAFPGIACDAYCEEGAWSLEQTHRLFAAAADLGCPLRVHADQFHSLGMTGLAVDMGAVSVDHLEATTPIDLADLANSPTIGVALPASGFQVDDRYAPARQFVDSGGALAIATNYNPGSAPTPSMPFTIALACRKLRLTVAEAISACTFNAACVLGLEHETGSIDVGRRADLQVLDCRDEREIGYEVATPGPRLVMIGGEVVSERMPPND